MDTYQFIVGLLIAQIDFDDDQLESLVEGILLAAGECQKAALVVNTSKGDLDVSDDLSGLSSLAETIGKAFTNLTDTDKTTIKTAVAKLIRYPDNPMLEGALEQLFNNYLDLLEAVKVARAYAATLTQKEP